MELVLSQQEYQSIKRSYNNLLALFINMDYVKDHFIDGIFKWGEQLDFEKKDLYDIISNPESVKYSPPKDKVEAIEWVYDLVYMIYLDGKVEDVELEIATEFATKLGFEAHVTNDLLKAIVTAPYDGVEGKDVKTEIRKHVDEILKNNAA